MTEKLWGEWVFVTAGGKSKWIHSDMMVNGVDKINNSKRSFVSFVIEPINTMCKAVMDNELNKKGELKAFNMARAVGIDLSEEKYRCEALYSGPQNDETARAIMSCDYCETAPTTMYISKMIAQADNRFIAHGRVFSGRVRAGQKMYMASDNKHATGRTHAPTEIIESVVVIVNNRPAVTVDEARAGQLCGVMGINRLYLKSRTISTSPT
eukprot:gene30805-38073_t